MLGFLEIKLNRNAPNGELTTECTATGREAIITVTVWAICRSNFYRGTGRG